MLGAADARDLASFNKVGYFTKVYSLRIVSQTVQPLLGHLAIRMFISIEFSEYVVSVLEVRPCLLVIPKGIPD